MVRAGEVGSPDDDLPVSVLVARLGPNIRAILSDIDEILAPAGDLIPNTYLVEWDPNAGELTNPSMERSIGIDAQRSVRVKQIVANDFKWVYDSFAVEGALEAVNPQILRALLARAYALVRHDIPKRNIEVDYQTFEQAIQEYRQSLPRRDYVW
jgi:hypothetical protein